MSAESDALLVALRARAIKRNAVRDEMRANTKAGRMASDQSLNAWAAYERAEKALSYALIAWEASEGIDDGTAEIMKPREPASE